MSAFNEAVSRAETIEVWTDGSCHPNPNGFGGWAAVFIAAGSRFELSGSAPGTTNNRMELTAAIEALSAIADAVESAPETQATSLREVILTSDSKYVVDGASKWLTGWVRSRRIRTVPNRDLWLQMFDLLPKLPISWVHIRGHQGNAENEACDRIANRERLALQAAGTPT